MADQKNADARFEREELGALLKLFSALGAAVSAGIVGAFFLGMKIDAWLAAAGRETNGAGRICGVLLGLGLSVYWAYLRIAGHLKRFAPSEESAPWEEPEE